MRVALAPKTRRRVSVPKPLPPPTGGLSLLDSGADLNTAVVLDNWFCEADHVRVRRGSADHAWVVPAAPIGSLMAWQGGTAAHLIAAANGGGLYNVTAPGAAAAASSGYVSDDWYATNFTTSGGQFLIACNGETHPVNYDGVDFEQAPAITGSGLDPAKLIFPFAYRERMFFLEKGTANVWYLGVDAIGGAAQKLALGAYLEKGGYLVAGTAWTLDSGRGPDDMAVFISSEGEIVVQMGTNPASATTWDHVGVILAGRPLGRRCFRDLGADVAILTSDGLMSLTRLMRAERSAQSAASFSAPIRPALRSAYQANPQGRFWGIHSYPSGNMAILNVDRTDGKHHQYAMNTLTGRWSRFTGIDAQCWTSMNDKAFCGTALGKVREFEKGAVDGAATIRCDLVTAWHDYDAPGFTTHVKDVRPSFKIDAPARYGLRVCENYKITLPEPDEIDLTSPDFYLWDVDLWDVAYWAGPDPVISEWVGGMGEGHALAIALSIVTGAVAPTVEVNIRLIAMDVLCERGSVIG